MSAKALLTVATLIGSLALAADAPVEVTKGNVQTFYREFPRLTKEPKVVMGNLLMLCIDVSGKIRQKRDEHGPHASHSIHVYANPVAKAAWSGLNKPFTPGSVIVKEKLSAEGKTVGVGGMIKRSAGYDAERGEWEYFYWDRDVGFSSGKLAKCAECHAQAKATDFVHSRKELEPGLK